MYDLLADSDEILLNTKGGCKFIYSFCEGRKINIDSYKTMIEGTMPVVLLHLQQKKINFYVVHGLECEKTLSSIEPELLDFIITNFNIINRVTRNKFIKSTKLKLVTRKAINLINDILNTQYTQKTKYNEKHIDVPIN